MKYQNDVLAPESKDQLFYSDFTWNEIAGKIDGIISEHPLLLAQAIHEKWVRAKTIPGAEESLEELKICENS